VSILLVVGVAFSVVVSTALVLTHTDTALSILIGLATIIITLLLDLMTRTNKMENRLVKVSSLSTDMMKNERLFAALTAIAQDYQKVLGKVEYAIFKDRAQAALSECQDALHNLVEGRMTVPPLSEYSFGVKEIFQMRSEIMATSYVDADWFWRSVAGENYFQVNVALAKRGVRITRVFIGDRDTLSKFGTYISRHKEAGIRVLVAVIDEIPISLCEDYLIGDQRILVQLDLTRQGVARAERITIDPQEVRRAINNFERLVQASYSFEQLFPNETG
jgi:hypothetical protein